MNLRVSKAMRSGSALMLVSSLKMSAFCKRQEAIKMAQKGTTLQSDNFCHMGEVGWFAPQDA